MNQTNLTISFLELERKDLGHFPNPLRSSFSKEDPCSYFDKFRILDEPEHDTGLITALHPLDRVYPLNDGSLPDVPNMHSGPDT